MGDSQVIDLNSSNFDRIIGDKKPVLVDFWAPWCGPCQIMIPIINELAADYKDKDKIAIAKVNIDENPEIAAKYKVMSVPTLLFFKDGKIVNHILGVTPKDDLEKALDKLIL